jgi:hypothetical protein
MLSQKCPKCRSSRIRRGYRPTSIFKKLFFRFNLLCDNCNWEFVGFALPGFKSPKQTRSSTQKKEYGKNVVSQTNERVENKPNKVESSSDLKHLKAKRKVKIRI